MSKKVNPSPNISAGLVQAEVSSLRQAIVDLVRNVVNELQTHASRLNAMFARDGSEAMSGPLLLASYTKTTLPDVATSGIIYVTNDVGGAVPAFSDGVNWRRVTDRNIIS